jgi:hypothetical protein
MSLQTRPIIIAFERAPDEGKGLLRDMRFAGRSKRSAPPHLPISTLA